MALSGLLKVTVVQVSVVVVVVVVIVVVVVVVVVEVVNRRSSGINSRTHGECGVTPQTVVII